MELRIRSARTTKDIDLTLHKGTRLSKDPVERRNQVRAMLQEAAAVGLQDYFEFLIGEAREELDGAPDGGSRYPVEARMDGREFARFHADIGIGDEVLKPLDVVEGTDWLGFGGIAPPSFPVISREQQFAEKMHAVLTASRGSPEHQNERSDRYAASRSTGKARRPETVGRNKSNVREEGDTLHTSEAGAAAL